MIASAEETLPAIVPDCECEVADEVFDTVVAPGLVSVENYLGVRERFVASIDAGVSADLHGLGTD